jgi:hypothetical protein
LGKETLTIQQEYIARTGSKRHPHNIQHCAFYKVMSCCKTSV